MIYAVTDGTCIKIGYTSGDGRLPARIAELQCGQSVELSLLATVEGDISHERKLHALLQTYRVRGEWFRRSEVVEATVLAMRKQSHAQVVVNLLEKLRLKKANGQPYRPTRSFRRRIAKMPILQLMAFSADLNREGDCARAMFIDELVRKRGDRLEHPAGGLALVPINAETA